MATASVLSGRPVLVVLHAAEPHLWGMDINPLVRKGIVAANHEQHFNEGAVSEALSSSPYLWRRCWLH